MDKKPGKIISIENLFFSYNQHPVLRDVNIDIYEREVVSIVGPNGGGKTTLLRLILGLLKPKSGTILVDGKPPASASEIIGYVPQRAHHDNRFPITVYEAVLSGRVRPFGFYSKKDRVKAAQSLEDAGLADLIKEPFSNLSGGQIQRVLIARALATEARILMLDEPTSNIDPSAGDTLSSLLKKLNKTMTILLVTHDTAFVSSITDRALCINKTLVEHPADDNFCGMLATVYGDNTLVVRHEKLIAKGSSNKCSHGDNK
jgi:zinc transport system ATP-binding protein